MDQSKNPVHLYWATNSLDSFIEELKKLHNSVFINFVPKEFVKPLESIGFRILCEFIDIFNEDIMSTLTGFNDYSDIQFLLPSEVAVHPDYQGQGYGKLLIEQALCYGTNNGAKRGF